MGQKVHPKGFRLAVRRNWDSRWFANKKNFSLFLREDYLIRQFLAKKFRYASVAKIFIERAGNRVRVRIYTARSGVIIGRKGQELEGTRDQLSKMIGREVILDVYEVKKPDINAQLVADNIALQIERRISYRRAMKKAVQSAMSLGALGIRLQCSGRLAGAEIARTEKQRDGSVPLHTLRANIDYGFAEANTVYGKIGIKVWICKKSDEE